MSEELRNQAADDVQALKADIAKALENELLARFLRKIAYAASYSPGRTPDQVAWAEGKRALAAQLLTMGGRYDGRNGTEFDE